MKYKFGKLTNNNTCAGKLIHLSVVCSVVPMHQTDRTARTVRQCAGVPCENGAPIPNFDYRFYDSLSRSEMYKPMLIWCISAWVKVIGVNDMYDKHVVDRL